MKYILKRTLWLGVILMSILLLSIFIQSCSNDFELVDNSNEFPISNAFDTNVDFSPNVANPYDFIGKYHNEGLQFVIDEYGKLPRLKAEQELEEQIKDLVVSYMEENDIFRSSNIKTSIDLSSLLIIDKINLNQIKLKNDILFPNNDQQKYYEKLTNVYSNMNISSPQTLINCINEIEDNIIEDKKLNDEEISQLLITTAVAKYSSIYWIDYFLKLNDSGVGIRLKNGSESGDNFSNWWKNTFMPKAGQIVEADFMGAAAGALMGVVAGGTVGTLVAPGPGTITVAITGAISGGAQGAIGSSVVAGIVVTFFKK